MAASEKRLSGCLIFSIGLHVSIVLILILGFEQKNSVAVIENTNQHDVISAVVLGETAKSKILPSKPMVAAKARPMTKPKLSIVKPELEKEIKEVKQELTKANIKPLFDPDAIALEKAVKKKKLDEELAKKQRELLAKDLLADIKKQTKKQRDKQKKIELAKLKAQFQKTLQEQTEKSLRQQLLNEEIKLQSSVARQSQGEINKYKALIIQAISEHWLVPGQANKKLYCELVIRLAPGGVVLDVQIAHSSGDVALDHSARAAVLKASPLPVPHDTQEFEAFKQFILKVKPENVLLRS